MPKPYVLIVDDDPGVATTLYDLIQEEGFEARIANNGLQALDLMRAGQPQPSLILLDLIMPKLSGWEVLERLRLSPRLQEIPVVVMSGSQRVAPFGALDFLMKPVSLDALLQVVHEYCDDELLDEKFDASDNGVAN